MNEKYNSENEIQLRRFNNNLAGCGSGYILFGLWSVIKTIMEVLFNKNYAEELVKGVDVTPEQMIIFRIIEDIIIVLLLTLVILVHLYVGRGAIRYSRGSNKKAFLVFAALAFIVNLVLMPGYYQSFKDGTEKIDTIIVSAAADVMVLFILADMFYSVSMIKKHTAALTVKEDGDAG